MKLMSESFTDGAAIPAQFAFAVSDAVNHITLSSNISPHLTWSDVPAETQSFALICHDPDAPSEVTDVNIEGRTVSADLPRATFFHWTLFDIPGDVREIDAGAHSNGITARGKAASAITGSLRHGINDYTSWFANDADMAGTYFGYDGPCPPWNDEIAHRYVFTLYALAAPTLTVATPASGAAVREALAAAPVLATAELTGYYTLNPDVALHA